ncbi:MAG: hypothetical protein H6822_08290 [Planctomycetaceae bacterium]|nr:hypothetical protein [Planctomycetales bacterium]MCB9922167.1 hypothetical protein [Planctomycetaceae bacterium]
MPLSICDGADSKWDYTQNGSVGISEERAGKAGNFRTFETTTDDSAEKVVLWYAKRLGLPQDHSLVTRAEKGFATLENQTIIKAGHGHDTDDRQDHTTMVALLGPAHAHITFLHRPHFDSQQDITISIAQLPDGKTSVVVIRPKLGALRRVGGNP